MPGLALKLIVGLGNPGAEYAQTRHNAGFWLVDELARRHGAAFRNESKQQSEIARVRIGGVELWLQKPQSYMNRSGGAIAGLANFYKIAPPEILVVHDDLDLPVGAVRLKEAGGHGGHNGLRDAIAHLGDAFWRLRIGIGHPGDKSLVVDYALTRAARAEQQLLDAAVGRGADVIPQLLAEGPQRAMNWLHTTAPAGAEGKAE